MSAPTLAPADEPSGLGGGDAGPARSDKQPGDVTVTETGEGAFQVAQAPLRRVR